MPCDAATALCSSLGMDPPYRRSSTRSFASPAPRGDRHPDAGPRPGHGNTSSAPPSCSPIRSPLTFVAWTQRSAQHRAGHAARGGDYLVTVADTRPAARPGLSGRYCVTLVSSAQARELHPHGDGRRRLAGHGAGAAAREACGARRPERPAGGARPGVHRAMPGKAIVPPSINTPPSVDNGSGRDARSRFDATIDGEARSSSWRSRHRCSPAACPPPVLAQRAAHGPCPEAPRLGREPWGSWRWRSSVPHRRTRLPASGPVSLPLRPRTGCPPEAVVVPKREKGRWKFLAVACVQYVLHVIMLQQQSRRKHQHERYHIIGLGPAHGAASTSEGRVCSAVTPRVPEHHIESRQDAQALDRVAHVPTEIVRCVTVRYVLLAVCARHCGVIALFPLASWPPSRESSVAWWRSHVVLLFYNL